MNNKIEIVSLVDLFLYLDDISDKANISLNPNQSQIITQKSFL